MVLEKPTKAARREALADLPLKLNDAYAGMLARIQDSSRSPHLTGNLGMQVLMWLHLATRPLRLKELQHALAVVLEEGKRGNVDLDEDQIPTQKRLLDSCIGLVIVDEETLTFDLCTTRWRNTSSVITMASHISQITTSWQLKFV